MRYVLAFFRWNNIGDVNIDCYCYFIVLLKSRSNKLIENWIDVFNESVKRQ
jgi:hypothetical protein